MTHFQYTAKEKQIIDSAYDRVSWMVDRFDHDNVLATALKQIRKGRSSITVAKALAVSAFLQGFGTDPRASEIARHGGGPYMQLLIVLGADAKSRGPGPGATEAHLFNCFPDLARDAVAAHDTYIVRGGRAAAQAITG
jgi:hypothetical protein